MKNTIIRYSGIAALALCLLPALRAQGQATTEYMREFTISGGGVANKDLDSSLGSLNLSLGQFLSPNLEVVLRQSINYSNPDNAGSLWNASTRGAIDLHLTDTRVQPFIGVNLGGVYGAGVRDSWAAGLEGGFKVALDTRTFAFVMADYAWLSERASGLNDRFGDGQFSWNVGVGYRF